MDANNKPDNGKRRVFIPSFLRRSGIKLKADVCAEPSEQGAPVQVPDRSRNPGSEPATPELQPHSHKPQRRRAWRPRSFLNEIATTPMTRTRHRDSPADTGEAKKAETKSDTFTSATRSSSKSDKSTHMEGDESEVPGAADDGPSTTAIYAVEYGSLTQFMRGEDEASKGTGSNSGAGTLTPPSSVAEQIDGVDEDPETSSKAPGATVQLSPAMAAYEVAREYQRRVDRGEVRAPTAQDRANYVNWKCNYTAWLAKKRGEEARDNVRRLGDRQTQLVGLF